MNVPSRFHLAQESSPLVRAATSLALQDVLQFACLAVLLLAVYDGAGPTRPDALRCLALDLAALAAGVVASRGAMAPSPAAWAAYRAATCVPVLATFAQLHLILPAASRARADALLLALDERLLRYEPAVAWDAWVSPGVTEWFSFFYVSYFALLAAHVLPMLLLERRGRPPGRGGGFPRCGERTGGRRAPRPHRSGSHTAAGSPHEAGASRRRHRRQRQATAKGLWRRPIWDPLPALWGDPPGVARVRALQGVERADRTPSPAALRLTSSLAPAA